METYISLLRGINVSGQKKIRMADLRALYESLDLQNVKSYVQSGNVVFRAEGIPGTLTTKIQDGIKDQYGFDVPVMVFSLGEWQSIMDANPYPAATDPKTLYITLMQPHPKTEAIPQPDNLPMQPGEAFQFIDGTLYFHCPNGYGRTKLSNNFWESKLKITATTRNWRTMTQLLALAQDMNTP